MKLTKNRLKTPLFSGTEWTVDQLKTGWELIDLVGNKYGWKGYDSQIEIINTNQIIEYYINVGLPVQFPSWKNGRDKINAEKYFHENGNSILEMVINTDPSICYIMESNTLAKQLLVLAHAGVGHNHFFKNNYLFKEWSNADTIIDFLIYGRDFIQKCEEQYGQKSVEVILDGAQFLSRYSVQKYKRVFHSKVQKQAKFELRRSEYQKRFDPVLDSEYSIVRRKNLAIDSDPQNLGSNSGVFSNESILEFLEELPEHITGLNNWQKEIFRIVRLKEQYFYPQIQTKLMNEGYATFVQSIILDDLYELGYLDESLMLELCHVKSCCTTQFDFSLKYGQELNPYFLGNEIFKDIKRMCENPTDEDKEFLPNYCNTDWIKSINFIVANYRDESFIREFLSPYLIRKLKLFSIETTKYLDHFEITNIHSNESYQKLREIMADQYSWTSYFPNVEINCYEGNRIRVIIEEIHGNKLTEESEIGLKNWLEGFTGKDVDIGVEG